MSTSRFWLKWAPSLLVVLAWGFSTAVADVWFASTGANSSDPLPVASNQAPATLVVENSTSTVRFDVLTAGIRVSSFKTQDGEFTTVGWPGAAFLGDVGAPAIPVIRQLLIAPMGADVTATASISTAPRTLDAKMLGGAFRLAPVRAPILKTPGAAENARYLVNAAAYAVDSDLPDSRVSIIEAGIVSGTRLVIVEVRPIAYNPVDQTLKIYPALKVEVNFSHVPANEAALMKGLERTVLNPPESAQPRDPTGNYLIVVASAYASDITNFAAAKEAQGYKVTIWTAAAGSTTTQIKNYIQGLHAEPDNRPDYVLLIGDTNTIPNWTGGGEGTPPTDLPYVCMDGAADWYPDIAIGRFPVRSSAQLANVIEKTLYFENGPLADPTYLSRAVFMSSEDNYTVSEGTHEYCISTYMDPFNMECDKLYSHTYNATPQQVRDAFNAGRILGIYSGHGGELLWADGPPFTQADVNGLFNTNMYPFVSSFACLTGDYTQPECFSETWILAPDKGAAGIWASSVNSYWTEDDALQRIMFSVLYDDYIRELGPCFNQTRVRYATQMGTGLTTRRYFEMYNLMGDPSLGIAEAEAALRVSPSGVIRSAGPEGGPFTPDSAEFSLRNVSDIPIDYQLVMSDWLILQSGSSAGTIQPGASTLITIGIGPDALLLPIGLHTATVTFTNVTNHIGDAYRQFEIEVGRYAFTSADVPKPINDNATVSSVVNVDQHVCMGDVNVDVNIAHTYIGDMVVRLQSPKGTSVTLHNRTGGSAENLVVTYDDEVSAPDGPGLLANFIRESAFGTWTLTVSDQAGGDTGTLNGWTLRILPLGDVCPPVAHDVAVQTHVNLPVSFLLQGETEGAGPLTYVLATLPANGVLQDVETGALITSTPYQLANYGKQLRYRGANDFQGTDQFNYRVSDVETGVSELATVAIDVGGTQLIRSFPLDVNPGWTMTGQWQYGQPLGQGTHNPDPIAGFSGAHVFGYNLSGDYPNSMASPMYLTTTAIDCRSATDVQLKFRRWLGVESASYDHADLQISNNGTSWIPVWQHAGASLSETEWSLQTYSISSIADDQGSVFVRWGMGPTDSSVTYSGWNIDDIEVWGRLPGPVLGDLNCDGVCDVNDVSPFVLSVIDRDAYLSSFPNCMIDLADANGDLNLDGADVEAFVEVMLGS